MSTSEKIKKEISELLVEAPNLMELASQNQCRDFSIAYQRWYTKAYKIVETIACDRLDEFVSYYLIKPTRKKMEVSTYVIQDYIKGIVPLEIYGKSLFDYQTIIITRVRNQADILEALFCRIDNVLQDVKGHLFAELQDSELDTAIKLKKVSIRAAGALAGVVLEKHLQRVCDNHHITINKKNPTISDFNEPLKKNGIYDQPTWRKIQLLADIRNICSHNKANEPTEEQVDELISVVNHIIKSIF